MPGSSTCAPHRGMGVRSDTSFTNTSAMAANALSAYTPATAGSCTPVSSTMAAP